MTKLEKLKAATETVPDATFEGIYKGKFYFTGVAVVLSCNADLIKLGAALAEQDAYELIESQLHLDDRGKYGRIVAWEMELFEGYEGEDDDDDDEE